MCILSHPPGAGGIDICNCYELVIPAECPGTNFTDGSRPNQPKSQMIPLLCHFATSGRRACAREVNQRSPGRAKSAIPKIEPVKRYAADAEPETTSPPKIRVVVSVEQSYCQKECPAERPDCRPKERQDNRDWHQAGCHNAQSLNWCHVEDFASRPARHMSRVHGIPRSTTSVLMMLRGSSA